MRIRFSVELRDYPKLIKEIIVFAPSIRWQSDITYIRFGEKFYHNAPKIHHSDRGDQYIYKEYISLLRECLI